MDASFILYAILVLGSTAVLICRAGLMTPKTDPVIRWQHLCMLAGLVFGLALAIAGNPTAAGACHAALADPRPASPLDSLVRGLGRDAADADAPDGDP
jgi:hypothetical protein